MCHREPMVEVVEPGGQRTLYGNVTPQTARQIAAATSVHAGSGRAAPTPSPAVTSTTGSRSASCSRTAARSTRSTSTTTWPATATRPRTLPQGTVAGAGDRRHHGLRPARARRRRLSPPDANGRSARAQAGPVKYVICNGDEGDPGAFMDRAGARIRPAPRARRAGHRRLRRRRRGRLSSTSAPNIRWPCATCAPPSARPRSAASSAACASRSAKARARSSAARRRR